MAIFNSYVLPRFAQELGILGVSKCCAKTANFGF
jgi:hypothetical protein